MPQIEEVSTTTTSSTSSSSSSSVSEREREVTELMKKDQQEKEEARKWMLGESQFVGRDMAFRTLVDNTDECRAIFRGKMAYTIQREATKGFGSEVIVVDPYNAEYFRTFLPSKGYTILSDKYSDEDGLVRLVFSWAKEPSTTTTST